MARIGNEWWERRLVLSSLLAWMIVGALFAWGQSALNLPKQRDISGGAVVQRERIDRFIDSTAELDIDDAIESLKDSTEGFQLAQLASQSPSSLYSIYMKQVVADRRVAKIYEAFEAFSKEDRAKRASDVYYSSFRAFEEGWEGFRNGDLFFLQLAPLHHSASVGLFLCACFGTPEELHQKIDDWESRMKDPKYNAIQGVEHLRHFRFPDALFTMNLVIIAGHQNGRRLEDVSTRLDKVISTISSDKVPFLRVDNVRMFKWNAETNDTDFTHITRGVPASSSDILVSLPGFTRTSPHLSDPKVCNLLSAEVRAWATGN